MMKAGSGPRRTVSGHKDTRTYITHFTVVIKSVFRDMLIKGMVYSIVFVYYRSCPFGMGNGPVYFTSLITVYNCTLCK